MKDNERFRNLFTLYAEKKHTASEKEELLRMIGSSGYDELLEQLINESWNISIPEWVRENEEEKANAIFQSVMNRVKVKRLISYRRIAVAASVILMVGVGSYFLYFHKPFESTKLVKTYIPHDVKAPQNNRAMISLSNGGKLFLDSASNGLIATQGNVKIKKLGDGQIIYSGTAMDVSYNTLLNPRGSKAINLVLSDGTKVWLNAASSLTYPTAFTGKERKVTITGEAYFEVAHNSNMPFSLSKGETKVQVLGTHFNINAYDDESVIKVTLLEGSVKVNYGTASGVLKPGQQAQVTKEIKVINTVDLDQVLGWKNGKFEFGESTRLEDIMRQIARWYDVEILYKGKADQSFGGTISRQVNVSKILEKFELTGLVKFQIEGKKIVVMR